MPGSGVVVDTSAWIEYFRRPSPVADLTEELMRDGRAAVAGPVLLELLQGTRTPEQAEAILSTLEGLPFLELPRPLWIKAGFLSSGLLTKGVTLPMMDILIAVCAIENQCSVLTMDAHCEQVPGVTLCTLPRLR